MHYDRYKSNRSACIRITGKFLSFKTVISDIDTLHVLDLETSNIRTFYFQQIKLLFVLLRINRSHQNLLLSTRNIWTK